MFTKIGEAAIRVISYINRKLKKISTTKLKVLTICSGILYFCFLFWSTLKNSEIVFIFTIIFAMIFGWLLAQVVIRIFIDIGK